MRFSILYKKGLYGRKIYLISIPADTEYEAIKSFQTTHSEAIIVDIRRSI